ncbi:MAG: TIGR03960 family B12-binding radical SAM protein [Deltaproteobacteria bacterium]
MLGLRKPARYIGSEWNVRKSAFGDARVKCALCFPDLYEVGMSNLGLRILYDVVNRVEGACCERVFSPDLDMEKFLRENNEPLFSLESQQPLSRFDLVAFNIGYELGYTNVLNVLDLSRIPLKSSERSAQDPVIIAGGSAVLNPEPIHEFIDAFFVGEGEEGMAEIAAAVRDHKASSSREEMLGRLAAIEGVYVPSLYKGGHSIKKRFVADLENSAFPIDWLVPYIQLVHDRVTVEVMRGCPNRCRFCQARSQYYPLRIRKPDTVCRLAEEAFRRTGYEEISLAGLSVSDYPGLKEVLSSLIGRFKKEGVGLSLPSIKPKLMLGELSTLIASIRKTGLTFAPEAGSDRLRRVIGKDFTEEELFATLTKAYEAGYQHVKLYFMIGLPSETDADLDAIVDLAQRVSDLSRKLKGRPAQVNISVNTLIPKPHTPFQWEGVLPEAEIQRRQEYIKRKTRNRNLRFSFHNRSMSFLESVFSRGDRALSPVILSAYRKGCRFDGWDEHLNLAAWTDSFKECGVDPQRYLAARDISVSLPWDFIDTGIPKEELLREYKRSREEAA